MSHQILDSVMYNWGNTCMWKCWPCHIRSCGGSDVLHDSLYPVPPYSCRHGRQGVNSFLGLNSQKWHWMQTSVSWKESWMPLVSFCLFINTWHIHLSENRFESSMCIICCVFWNSVSTYRSNLTPQKTQCPVNSGSKIFVAQTSTTVLKTNLTRSYVLSRVFGSRSCAVPGTPSHCSRSTGQSHRPGRKPAETKRPARE